MIASLSVVLSLFLSGFILMIRELKKAPEAIEDESGFRVIRAAASTKARPAKRPAHRGFSWAFHRA